MPNAAPAIGVRTRATVARSTEAYPFAYWALILLILAVSVFTRVWNIAEADLWSDEVITAYRVQGTLDQALESLYAVGNQAPFFYMFMRMVPNDSPFLMRLPSLLLGVLGVALAIHFTWKLYGNRPLALWTGALLAINPMHIILSRTARFYTLLFVLGLVITYCYFMIVLRKKGSNRLWALFFASSLLAYLTHYSVLALPATQFFMIVLNWKRHRHIFWRWAIMQFLAVLPFLGWLALSLTKMNGSPYPVLPQNPRIQDIPLSLMNILTGYGGQFTWILLPGLTIAVMGIAFGIQRAIAERHHNSELVYWLMLAVVPIIVLFVMNYLTGVNYRDRYFLVSMPAVLLLFWYGWENDDYPVRQIALAAVLLTSAFLAMQMFYTGSYERTDWSQASEFVADEFQPGDRILFERDMIFTAFSTYFYGDDAALDASYILMDEPDIEVIEDGATRIWAVYRIRHEDFHRAGWVENLDPLTPGLSPISDWLVAHEDQIVYQQPFKGGVIYLVDPAESLAQN